MDPKTKAVLYTCSFVPCELIAACGWRPQRITPRSGARDLVGPTAGLCAYARAFVNSVCAYDHAAAIVVTTVCDQMRRLGELIAPISDTPVFVMNVPSTWQSEPARGLYVDEIKRLAGFLAGLGGKTPSDPRLADVMVEFDAARSKLRQSSQLLSPRQYSRAIAAMHHGERPALAGGGRGHAPQGIPLAILGGELLDEDLAIFDSFEKAGGRIVLDATDTGERTLPCPFDPHLLPAAPLMELARAYFGTIPHAFRRPNDPLYRYLADELAARDVRGIIFRRYQWCDLWNAELPTLRDRLAMPVLDLDAGRQGDETIRLDGRIQAFMETLR